MVIVGSYRWVDCGHVSWRRLVISRGMIFVICNFRTASFFINRCQTWTIHGLWRKMRYQHKDKKISQRSVLIMLPYNNIQIENSGPTYKCGLSFLRCLVSLYSTDWLSLNNTARYISQKKDEHTRASSLLDEAYRMREKLGLDHRDTSLIFNNRGKIKAGYFYWTFNLSCNHPLCK